jgi:endonuclease III
MRQSHDSLAAFGPNCLCRFGAAILNCQIAIVFVIKSYEKTTSDVFIWLISMIKITNNISWGDNMKRSYTRLTILAVSVLMLSGSVVGAQQPQDITAALSTIEREYIAYPSRNDDLQTLKQWLADGDYSLARSKASGIIEQQRNLRQTQQNGLPEDIQQMLNTITREAVAYPSRNDELQTLKRWLADGDYSLARSKASGIIKQQRNLRQAQDNAMPEDIQQMLNTITREAVAYPSRNDDLRTLKRWLADGDYSLARSKASGIIKQQRNLRQTQQNGLPEDIQQMLSTITREAVAYPSRNDELQTLKRWLADGDYSLARSKASGIIKQQRNLRNGK